MNDSTNMEICTTIGCRMMCSYCPQTTLIDAYKDRLEKIPYRERPDSDRFMRFTTFDYCLRKLPKEVGICFAGMAEPFLNPLCRAMILLAEAEQHQVSLFSTLSGATVADIEAIKHVRFRHCTIHLPDAEGQMRLHVTPEYLETLQAAARSLHGINFVVYGTLHPCVREALGKAVEDSSRGLISRASTLKDREIPWKPGKLQCSSCGPTIDHNVLMPNGDVALCCMVYDLKHVIGNLIHDSYEDLFKSPEYLRVMRGLAGDESIDIACRKCEVSVPIP